MAEYVEVEECPSPILGLRWTEMYAYYGEVVAVVSKQMCFEGREPRTLDEEFFVIDDTSVDRPYLLSGEEFKRKFSYGHGNSRCWVRFSFPKEEATGDE